MPQTEVKGYIDEATHAAITDISRSSKRPVEEIVGEAVADYAARHARYRRGLKDIEEGRFCTEEEMDAFFDDWIKNG
ncbi:hypothetical protein C882_1294 [Caenispirillum salinarum AK4]|uniref:CopG family transcriptional regulator n=1 Tax=Caenispirillum salinarum AK4 TaxID=1238182 RepID=K9GSJ3_9PROT|nr:hypothetical protein [Caenispirillum salinarum]EKV27699.1 hypothetical protein C882_1294 [Caenispirillum salinarum AK4]